MVCIKEIIHMSAINDGRNLWQVFSVLHLTVIRWWVPLKVDMLHTDIDMYNIDMSWSNVNS